MYSQQQLNMNGEIEIWLTPKVHSRSYKIFLDPVKPQFWNKKLLQIHYLLETSVWEISKQIWEILASLAKQLCYKMMKLQSPVVEHPGSLQSGVFLTRMDLLYHSVCKVKCHFIFPCLWFIQFILTF